MNQTYCMRATLILSWRTCVFDVGDLNFLDPRYGMFRMPVNFNMVAKKPLQIFKERATACVSYQKRRSKT